MDSDDNRNVISDRQDEYSVVFKDEWQDDKMIPVTWRPCRRYFSKNVSKVFSVRFAPDPQQALAELIELVNQLPKLPFFPRKSPRPRGRQHRSSPAAHLAHGSDRLRWLDYRGVCHCYFAPALLIAPHPLIVTVDRWPGDSWGALWFRTTVQHLQCSGRSRAAQNGGDRKAIRVTIAVFLLSRHACLFPAYRPWFGENGIRYPLTSRLARIHDQPPPVRMRSGQPCMAGCLTPQASFLRGHPTRPRPFMTIRSPALHPIKRCVIKAFGFATNQHYFGAAGERQQVGGSKAGGTAAATLQRQVCAPQRP